MPEGCTTSSSTVLIPRRSRRSTRASSGSVTYRSRDFVVVFADQTTSGIAFQFAPDHQPPQWPDPTRHQQMHFDVMVDDLAAVASDLISRGARALADEHAGSQVRRSCRPSLLPHPSTPLVTTGLRRRGWRLNVLRSGQ
jgi:hypothetical protein